MALSVRAPEVRRIAIGVLLAAVTVVAGGVSGMDHQMYSALVIMGFDPDRALLIRALLVGLSAAAASALANGRVGMATLLGLLGFAALFGPTFAVETRSAAGSTGAASAFDLAGWVITLLSLAVSGVISGWAGATLAIGARPAILDTFSTASWTAARVLALLLLGLSGLLSGWGGATRVAGTRGAIVDTLRQVGSKMNRLRVEGRAIRRAGVVAVVATLLVATVPAFGNMVNYSPDALMLHGGPPHVGLGGFASTVDVGWGPWLAWLPSGNGNVDTANVPAPWIGTPTTAELAIYTPPGYDPTKSRRYPTLYEAPTPFRDWDSATNVKVALDTLIDTGAMPAAIVVFISSSGGPYEDSECADSFDGREWFDRYVAQTVVPWVDSHYRTIAQPAARAIMGMSQGGYCAAILALHHPDVFGTSITFSGYFHAGIPIGANTSRPFGGDPALLDAASPDVVVGQLAPAVRANLYFIVIAQTSQPPFGPMAASFDRLLAANGYPYLAIPAAVTHGWGQVRQETPTALEVWAARLSATGVF